MHRFFTTSMMLGLLATACGKSEGPAPTAAKAVSPAPASGGNDAGPSISAESAEAMKKAPFSKEVANPRGSQAAPIAPQAPIIPLDFTEQALARLTANSDSTEANPNTQAPNDSRTIEQVSRDAALYSQYLLEFDKALAAKDSAKANELLHLLVDNADHGSLFDRHALRVKLRKLMEK